jgi:hypothetical protein
MQNLFSHECEVDLADNTKTPKPFSSPHQMVNCLARGTAASTTDFVSLGIRQASENSPKTHHEIEGGGP